MGEASAHGIVSLIAVTLLCSPSADASPYCTQVNTMAETVEACSVLLTCIAIGGRILRVPQRNFRLSRVSDE